MENSMEAENGIAVFSEEERREIAAQIEAAAGRSPMAISRMPAKGEASKRGLFPLLVNAGAVIFLAAGICFMFFFQRGEAAEINESGVILGITERRLIEEIRRETSLRISEKEAAIEEMSARIAEVDAELAKLDSLESLSDDQKNAMAALRGRHDEYQLSLEGLRNERAQILAEARQKEAALYAKLEEREGAMENLSVQNRQELEAVRDEFVKLLGDEEKAALAEQQINAYFSTAEKQVRALQYGEALNTLAALKEFLVTPSLQTLRPIQARRESGLAAAAALSTTVESLKNGGVVPASPAAAQPPAAAPLPAFVPASGSGKTETELRRQLESQNAANAAGLAEREQIIEDLRKEQSGLQSRNAELQQSLTGKDTQIKSLETQNESLRSQLQNLRNTLRNLTDEPAAQ